MLKIKIFVKVVNTLAGLYPVAASLRPHILSAYCAAPIMGARGFSATRTGVCVASTLKYRWARAHHSRAVHALTQLG